MSSKEDVLRTARLARIEISEGEIEEVKNKFSSILKHFDTLSELNTEGVEPLFHATESMKPRADVPQEPISTLDLMKNAPDHSDSCFRLPKVIGAVE